MALVVPRQLARQALDLDLAHGLGKVAGDVGTVSRNVDARLIDSVGDGVDAIVGVGGKLVRRLVVGILIGLDEVGVLLIVGGKRGHEQYALGKRGIEAFHREQAVHAVGTHERHVVAHILGVLEQNGRRRVVDRGKDECGAGLLGLGELRGETRGGIVLKGLGIDDVELGSLGLLGKGVGNARAIRIAGVVEQGDLGIRVLLCQKLGSAGAHGGIGEANLKDRGLVLGDVE